MATSFIERFYEEVSDNLADPVNTRRLPKSKRLRDLHAIDVQIWEQLLNVGGQESSPGQTEATITVVDGQAYYNLPGNFRQLLHFEKRDDGDRNNVTAKMLTIPTYDLTGPGVEIIDQNRGMIMRPVPTSNIAGDWTLVYQKGPIPMHYAKAGGIGPNWIQSGTPPTDGGELFTTNNYYDGSLIRVFSAVKGAPQTREIVWYDATAEPPIFHVRHEWSPLPKGEVWYEICPTLPLGYDSIYAMDVALRNTSRRSGLRRRTGLERDRMAMWSACFNWVASNTADRGPSRSMPPDPEAHHVYDQ